MRAQFAVQLKARLGQLANRAEVIGAAARHGLPVERRTERLARDLWALEADVQRETWRARNERCASRRGRLR